MSEITKLVVYLLSVMAVANGVNYGILYLIFYKCTEWYRWAGDKTTAYTLLTISLVVSVLCIDRWIVMAELVKNLFK